jgi:hypothetical protein
MRFKTFLKEDSQKLLYKKVDRGIVIGAEHDIDYYVEYIIPFVKTYMTEQKIDVLIGEGSVENIIYGDNEQTFFYKWLEKQLGKIKVDTWDVIDLTDDSSMIYKVLEDKYNLLHWKILAVAYCFEKGQGTNVEPEDFLTDEGINFLTSLGIKNVTNETELYDLVFPEDKNLPDNEVSDIAKIINSIRQNDLLNKIKKSNNFILLAGRSHLEELLSKGLI